MHKWLSRAGASVEAEESRPISCLGDVVERARKNALGSRRRGKQTFARAARWSAPSTPG
jgi:hypothetical protein